MSDSFLARAKFHEPHLLRVSRSFAYGIGRLETSLKAKVGLGYLLCRLLDTVEDASWATPVQQLDAFEKFDSFMQKSPLMADVEAWAQQFPTDIPDGEKILLSDAHQVFTEFHAQGEAERSAMLKPILSMSAGMKFFTRQTRERGALKLNSLAEVNSYCLFVAGVVGELLTGLVSHELSDSFSRKAFSEGCHFGLFLQKINILKDQWGDEREGRHFVPDREEMLRSVRLHADHALQYLLSIPLVRVDYRLFCAWGLFFGLSTIPRIETAKASDSEPTKLSRTRALFLGGKIEFAIKDDEKLKALYQSLIGESSALSQSAHEPMKHNSSSDLECIESALSLYKGELSANELVQVLTV